ncbi:MAG: tRNA (guanosine(46)-N7)-methyltransferase TrmB [Spirochaetes bacterium GWD1_27_9]|nr:MAG: tRNA (guanosine(46)-N7)-methyltransferase TrmB [Spirochaetes bacterium GWB1_27_13]OHD25721.1 MAG: tRNA (guanosine(46)-N7)-methyltransferase TrmB [Spirochaetes bacterium GWC1_27_15]OHD33100.1 MAG: tRNA (guanosine(46)-N7)-methyltransferase TrmB [Spirochaetes bacterium GWD1_27_9]
MFHIKEWDLKEEVFFHKKDYPKVSLEIGCGNGLFLCKIAKNNPDTHFFGIEVLSKCITKSKKKIESLALQNISLIHGDIFTSLSKFFEKNFFETIYINFPDPWFKRSHLKKRVVKDSMIGLYYEYLTTNGKIYFVTDNTDYRDAGVEDFIKTNLFSPFFEKPYYSNVLEDYPQSLYEQKWRCEGKEIFYSIFYKK